MGQWWPGALGLITQSSLKGGDTSEVVQEPLPQARQPPRPWVGRCGALQRQLTLPFEFLTEFVGEVLLFEALLLGKLPTQLIGLAHLQQGRAGAAMIALQSAQRPGAERRRIWGLPGRIVG